MKKLLSAMLVSVLLLVVCAPPARAAATEESTSVGAKKAKIVAKSALYGFGGGLVVGLASQVFKRKTKNVFLFGSLGLYAGIILGVYVITSSHGPAPYEGPDTYEDYSSQREQDLFGPLAASRAERGLLTAKPELKMNLVSLEF